jgi:hypothetical protein
MIPSCFVGTPSEESEKVDFTFSVPITPLTDYMQCRGIDATCTTGAIVGFKVLNDPDTYSINPIHWDPVLFTPPNWLLVSGSGDVGNLPTFGQNDSVGGDSILMGIIFGTFQSGTNISLKHNSSGIEVFQDIVPVRTNSEAISTNNGFDSTTVVKLEVTDYDDNLIELDIELIIACGAVSPVFYCGDDGLVARKSSYTPLGQTTRYCLFNKNGNSEPGFEEAAFQELYTTNQYTCCQTTECRSYTVTYVAKPLPQIIGQGGIYGGINNIQLEYIDTARERQTVTLSVGAPQTINAIENTVRPFTTNGGSSPATGDYVINNTMIAFSDSSFFSIVDNGPCS